MKKQNIDESANDFSAIHNEPEAQVALGPNILISEEEAAEIVAICNEAKQGMQDYAKPKKDAMRRSYAYFKNQLYENDLLPLPASRGKEKDLDSQRPKVFYPLSKQQIKRLYANIKLTFFPDDENFCRVKGLDSESAVFDEALTEGFVHLLKEMKATEKLGMSLLNVCWAGNAEVLPFIKRRTVWEWRIQAKDPLDPSAGEEYMPYEVELPPEIDIEALNPLNFYLDPTATDIECAKWAYYTVKKLQELKDNPLFFNIDKLKDISKKDVEKNTNQNSMGVNVYNGLSSSYKDSEDNVDYDLYYFPYIKTTKREYRNMIIAVGGNTVLIRFHPNTFPMGMNPVVHYTWMNDVDSLYGTGPGEELLDLQRNINILANYKIEQLARFGNRATISPGVDVSNAHGIAGGYMVTENPTRDVVFHHMDWGELGAIDNSIAILKQEGQMVGGAQDPFQGGANGDTEKTATEIQVLEGNSISISREIIEHISITGVEPSLLRVLYLMADIYDKPITVRVGDENGQPKYITVDFSVIKDERYNFTVEVIGTNPSQSKQAEVQGLSQLIQMVMQNPQGYHLAEPVVKKIAQLQGIKDIDALLDEIRERMFGRPGQPPSPPAADEAGMGVDSEQAVEGIPPAVTGGESEALPPPDGFA